MGRYSVNVLPSPGMLTSRISPPSSFDSSRLIARPRPVPPYLRDVEPSACWNASKMICCLSGEMPIPVSVNGERDHLLGLRRAPRSPATSPPSRAPIVSDTEPSCVNLKAFDSRFLMICCMRLMSVSIVRGTSESSCTSNADLLGLGDVAERALDVALQVEQPQLADVDDDGARLDLRQIEDVVDEGEQVVARRVDRLRRLDLPQAQVAFAVLGELVRQEQQAVQRRPQLVRHVRQELGLVLRGERELRRLLFERLPRLLDLRVLALDLLVLVRELPRLLLERLVRLLQLLGERLGLLQQVLRAACSPRSC